MHGGSSPSMSLRGKSQSRSRRYSATAMAIEHLCLMAPAQDKRTLVNFLRRGEVNEQPFVSTVPNYFDVARREARCDITFAAASRNHFLNFIGL